jgi:hypothetical protein
MIKTTSLYEVLYVSTLAPSSPLSVVGDIAGKARKFNEAQGITGLLLFDGMRFCQQLEGEQKLVLKLIEKIRLDPRHTNVQVLHNATLAERRFRRFSLGYTVVDEVDAFVALLTNVDLEA